MIDECTKAFEKWLWENRNVDDICKAEIWDAAWIAAKDIPNKHPDLTGGNVYHQDGAIGGIIEHWCNSPTCVACNPTQNPSLHDPRCIHGNMDDEQCQQCNQSMQIANQPSKTSDDSTEIPSNQP